MPSVYSTVFGGNLVAPALPTYLALNISSNVVLGWPLESNITAPSAAEIIDVTATAPGLTIQLSDARQVSTGYCALFNNVGANTVTVLDAQGNTLMAPTSGQAWQIYLADNSTLQGTWRVFQYGASISTANAATLAGAGLKAISTTLNEQIFINAQAVNYTIGSGTAQDRAACVEWTGGSGGTFSSLTAPTLGTGWFCYIKNGGTGVLTFSPGSGQVDGAASKSFNPNDSAILATDGTNFFTIGFGQAVASTFNFVTISLAGASGTVVLTGAQLNRVSYKFTGALAGNTSVQVPASIQQYWIDNETTGAFTLTITAGGAGSTFNVPQGARVILYCDGLNIVNAVSAGAGSTTLVADGTAAAPGLAWASETDMGLYKPGVNTLGFSTAGTARGNINATGQWTINAPSSGSALTVSTAAGGNAITATPGTVTGVAYSFSTNGGTGIWSSAGSNLDLATASTNRININSTGNVTINAPNSGAPLTINGTTGAGGFLSGTATTNGNITVDISNLSTGTSGASYFRAINSVDALNIGLTSTGFSGSFFSGAPAGEIGFLFTSGAVPLALGTNSVSRLNVSSAGNVTVNAPSTGTALTVTGVNGANLAVQINGSSTSGQSFGAQISAGTTAADYAFRVANQAGSVEYCRIYGDGHGNIGPSGALGLSWGTSGSVTINTPSSGAALTVNQVASGASSVLALNVINGSNYLTVTDGTSTFLLEEDGSHNHLIGTSSSHSLSLFTSNASRVVVGSAGNVTINAPSSGTPLTVNMASNTNGIFVTDGSILQVWGNNGTVGYIGTSNAKEIDLITNSATRIAIASTGNVTVNAPSSGVAVSASGASGQYAGQFIGLNSSGNSRGLQVIGGTNSSDVALIVANAAQTTNYFEVRGDGVVFGNDGTNLIELGYKDLPQNGQSGNYTLALSDRGKHIFFSSGTDTCTIPANASVAFPVGSTIVIVNSTGNNLTLQITTDQLSWFQGGSTSSGTRTIANGSVVTILKVASGTWVLTGGGIS